MPEVAHKRHRILFVDNEQDFLDVIGPLFGAWSGNTWEVHQASSSSRALDILQQHSMDLVVVDLQMPVVDGLQFIDLLNRKYPHLRKVVLTGHPTQEARDRSHHKGVELFPEKPQTSEHYKTVFATLNEVASLHPQEGFVGVLRQAGLPDILQMECLARNSSVLGISTAQQRGCIYIEKGDIIHAELGEVTGVEAFNALLCLRGGEFSLKPLSTPPQQTITGPWEFLVMEAARIRDEMAETAAPSEGPNPVPTPLPEPPPPTAAETVPFRVREPAPQVEMQIEEFVVCSAKTEVLYEWQCADVEDRIKLLQLTKSKAAIFSQIVPLGWFDRVEALGPEGRTVILAGTDRKVLMRSQPVSARPARGFGS